MRALLLILLLSGPAAAKDPLIEALGDPAKVAELLKERKPKTAHLEAALRGWPSSQFVTSAKLLLKAGAKPPKGEPEQYHALWDAVKAEDAELVRLLLAAGVKADALRGRKDEHTALMDAAYCSAGAPEHPEVVAALLDGGADPRAGSSEALKAAVRHCCPANLALLLDRGAPVQDASPDTPLCPAAARVLAGRGHKWWPYTAASIAVEGDTETAHVVLASTGLAPMDWSEWKARAGLRRALFGLAVPDFALAQRMLELGAASGLAGCDDGKRSLMQDAADRADPAVLLFLLKHGAAPGWVCEKESASPPLELALCRSTTEAVRALLKARGQVPSRRELIPVLLKAAQGYCPAAHVRVLLEEGAPVDEEERWNGTVFAEALQIHGKNQRQPEPELLDAFLARKPRLNGLQEDSPLYQALRWPEVARRLISAGARLDDRDPAHGRPLVVRLCDREQPDRMRTALELGADPDDESKTGQTALMACAGGGHAEMIKLLLDKGADPSRVDAKGRTALDIALETDKLEAAHVLRSASKPASAPAKPGALKQLVAQAVAEAREKEKPAPAPAAAPPVSDVDKPGYSAPEDPDAFAVVVGVEEYSELPKASFAERDAAAVRRHFRALGVPDRNLVLLSGAKAVRSSLAKYLESWLPKNVSERSRVYFYFSGHGAPDPSTGKAFLMPWDGDASFLADTAYPVERLYKSLDSLKAKQVVVALDACFSGAGGRSVLPEGARPLVTQVQKAPTGRLVVLAAAQPDQITGVIKEQGHGIFTYYLLKGLGGAAASADGSVTPESLFSYLKPKVEDEARRQNRGQSPSFSGPGGTALKLRSPAP